MCVGGGVEGGGGRNGLASPIPCLARICMLQLFVLFFGTLYFLSILS